MTTDEVRTAFHEFGHALHGLFSDAVYPRLQGTSVPRDFVEFPSQVNEMWAWWPEVLANYATHHETGEPLAQDVVDRLVASQSHGQGFDTVSMLGAALLDLEWHRLTEDSPAVAPEQVEDFETRALTRHGVLSALVPPRYRSGYFAHIFSGGYDAGYYSYLWSEVLDADMVDWFTENGGLARANGARSAVSCCRAAARWTRWRRSPPYVVAVRAPSRCCGVVGCVGDRRLLKQSVPAVVGILRIATTSPP
jgi:peptidyl-dipeptidase Dcp